MLTEYVNKPEGDGFEMRQGVPGLSGGAHQFKILGLNVQGPLGALCLYVSQFKALGIGDTHTIHCMEGNPQKCRKPGEE